MTWLLDGNVLIALSVPGHAHEQRATDWFRAHVQRFATCPITQGTLLRTYGRHIRARPDDAMRVLLRLIDLPEHEFWRDEFGYEAVPVAHLQGGAQVTDAYLAALARHHGGKVATLDAPFAKLYPDDVVLIA